jgi:hypothetical protein
MKVEMLKNSVVVRREPSDKKIYKETEFWHKVKRELQSQGYDVIKKLMWKDGHLVDSNEYYIRERKWKFYIRQIDYAIRPVYEFFNNEQETTLLLEYWEIAEDEAVDYTRDYSLTRPTY